MGADGRDPARLHRLVPRAPPPRHRRAAQPDVDAEPPAVARRGRSLRSALAGVTSPSRLHSVIGDGWARGHETAIVILGGGGARVGHLELPGRASVWDGLPSAAYLPPGVTATIAPVGRFGNRGGCACAPPRDGATREAPVRIGPEDVRVEIRGAGNATRQINHIITPEFPADRLEVVEVYTPRATGARGRRTSTTPTTCRTRRHIAVDDTLSALHPRFGPVGFAAFARDLKSRGGRSLCVWEP